jgi:hypothetical protein
VRARAPLAAGVGVFGALALALVATDHAPTTVHSPIRPDGGWAGVWSGGLIAAFGLYAVGLVWLARRGAPAVAVLAVAVAIQLAPLAAPLLLSTDVYSYWDYGRVAAVHHGNPYEDRPSRFADDPAYPLMGKDWQQKHTVYGPVFTLASEGHAKLVGHSHRAAAWLFRLLAALSVVAVAALVAVAARQRALAAALVGWNPLLALHFAGGGHNDALMAAFLVAGLVFATLGKRDAEGAAWSFAAAVKVVPLVFLPLRLLERRGRFGYRGLLAAAGGIAAVAFVAYGYHWLTIFSPVANQLRTSSSLGLPYWASRAGFPERYARDGLLLLFALSYLWLLRQAWHGRARLALTACVLLICTSWLQPWYAVWALPLAAVEEDQLARVVAVALSAYFLRDAIPI